jgi:hypothetical protein
MQNEIADTARKERPRRAPLLVIVFASLLIGGALAVVAIRGEAMLLDLANAVWAMCF